MKLVFLFSFLALAAFGHQTPYPHSHELFEASDLKLAWMAIVVGLALVTGVRALRRIRGAARRTYPPRSQGTLPG